MKFVQVCLATGLVFGIPFLAAAQQAKGSPSDIKYCNALGKAYSSMFPVMEGMPVSDAVAMSRWASFDHTLNGAAA